MPDSITAKRSGPIAIVSHTHPSVTKGGGEIAAYSLYEGLRRIGTDAIFISICPSVDQHKLLLGSDREFVIITDHMRYDHMYQLASSEVWRDLKEVLLREQVRLVNFHHFLMIGVNSLRALSIEMDIPYVVTLHEFLAICAHHGQMVTRPARRLCRMATPAACATCFPENSRQQFAARREVIQSALSPAAAFISPSHFLADRMVAWGLPREKFVVIENGLRVVEMRDARVRGMLDGRPWTFGFFGQITPFKGIDTLLDTIELLARQPDIAHKLRIRVHGNIVGQEPEFVARFDELTTRNSFATYAGAYDNADVHKLMQACDYILVPSTWWENSPVVIQEAYAAGRPVICTAIGGMAEKVQDRRSGLHFRLGDPSDLARAMYEAADESLYESLCSNLPEVHDQLAMARDYMASFDRLLQPVKMPAAGRAQSRRKAAT